MYGDRVFCSSHVQLMMSSEKSLNKMTVAELKAWLASRGAPTKGKKSELLDRVNACIKYGWEKVEKKEELSVPEVVLKFPESGWSPLPDMLSQSDYANCDFCMSHIVSYFVTRTVKDSLPAEDFKAINKSAENLSRCGHVQMIQSVAMDNTVFVKANCLPEMRKDRVYGVRIALGRNFDIVGAECGCPAGKGPHGSCKHIGALAYGLADFIRFKKSPEYLTCTDKLQKWNQPRARKVEPLPVCQLGDRRRELLSSKVRAKGSLAVFDPRPLHFRKPDLNAMENLRCDLLAINKPCGFLNLLVPSVEKISHDHSYNKRLTDVDEDEENLDLGIVVDGNFDVETQDFEELSILAEPAKTADDILKKLKLDEGKRQALEEGTRSQSSNPQWFEARLHRITGSKCGRILKQKEKTRPLLQSVIYPKPFLYLPKAIKWGRDNEEKARQKYVQYMENKGHKQLKVSPAGFVVHPQKGWLGASPDGWVIDPTSIPSHGILEIKCPYSKADESLDELCKDKNFYLHYVNGLLELDKKHEYYHQVQLQLYVAQDKAKWCDFCMYTLKGVCVHRIFPDPVWFKQECSLLDEYFFQHILPELLCPKCKPSYYL